jgi:hypothetical protein
MNEAFKQFSDEVAKNLKAKIESSEFASFIAQTKAAGDDRTFEVVMSTSDEDRQGDSLDQSNWDLKYFNLNPVVLWAHNYSGFPIGIVTDITIEGDKAIATGKFAPEGINPEADIACKLYQEKILKTVSPGYIQNDDGTRELLEMSFCSVPAGRLALSMRQVGAIGYSTPELIAKGFFYKKETPPMIKAKDPALGDTCELANGDPGVLAKDPENPDRLVCVPTESKSKSNETQENMNTALTKELKGEHDRHRAAVEKSIDEFETKAIPDEKSEGDSEMEKAITEFEEKMDSEHAEHRARCEKAIDDAAEKIDPEEKKSIDDFRKAIEDEHLNHVKCFDKAIDEFKGEVSDPKKCEKSITEFRAKANDELDRHEKAHNDMVKAEFGKAEKKMKGAVAETLEESAEWRLKSSRMNYISTVLYAFCDAYYGSPVEAFSELIGEAISIIEAYVSEEGKDDEDYDAKTVKALMEASIKKVEKSGRTISAKTKAKVEAVMKSIEEYHSEYTAEHGKFTDKAIAALKEVMTSPQGDEGKEGTGEKSSRTPNARSSSSRAAINKEAPLSDLDTYLFTQRLLRQVKSASEDGLRQIKEDLKAKFPSRR